MTRVEIGPERPWYWPAWLTIVAVMATIGLLLFHAVDPIW